MAAALLWTPVSHVSIILHECLNRAIVQGRSDGIIAHGDWKLETKVGLERGILLPVGVAGRQSMGKGNLGGRKSQKQQAVAMIYVQF